MKKNKIFIKLFAMTAGVVMILLVMQFIFQYFWLEKFYVYNKKETISNELIMLKGKLENGFINQENINKTLNQYSRENDIFIGISNSQGIPQYGLDGEGSLSYIEIEDDQKENYKIYMNAFSNEQDLIGGLKISKKIQVQGSIMNTKEKNVYPESITLENKKFSAKKDGEITSGIVITKDIEIDDALVVGNVEGNSIELNIDWTEIPKPQEIRLKGSIIDMNLMSEDDYGIEYRRSQLLQEIFSFLGQQKDLNTIFRENKMMQYTKVDSFTGIKNIIFVQPLFIKNKEPRLMFAVSSLQPIEETTDIMKTYFLFALIIAMLVAIMVSFLYSKKFTKPLLHLNGVTKNMADLDFSHKCRIHTNDEIEDLAENINSMSDKLKRTLEEVKESNEKLKEEIIFKEKMEQFRKRFIADASHELKTPLTVMKGICEGVVDGIYDYNDHDHFKKMLNEINDMSQLVYDLLEISKLESGKVPFKKEIFQLCDVVLKIHGKLKPLLERKELKVQLDLAEDFIIGDEDKIERVIRNLYSNAVQYTPENGEINIYIHHDQDHCYVNIENSPAKISKDDLSKIWEPFYRIEKSRNKALGGTGLGLHMVKGILDKHDSEYGIENTEKGVKVYFSLQRIVEEIEIESELEKSI
ncbi:sensor histidine kinase [Crassaminicella profunda]|uniref:sensor histidine kinase n=1 Tax=Crassaminicella profunda TaxID=1286698 RepID=UPI001CA71695|nr:HAMP domain-containing sensor histidine kinase [Crassaminicella profunda]QZY55823.1 HAMP domain-containing protein [Crassaminicella profunda]